MVNRLYQSDRQFNNSEKVVRSFLGHFPKNCKKRLRNCYCDRTGGLIEQLLRLDRRSDRAHFLRSYGPKGFPIQLPHLILSSLNTIFIIQCQNVQKYHQNYCKTCRSQVRENREPGGKSWYCYSQTYYSPPPPSPSHDHIPSWSHITVLQIKDVTFHQK